MSALHVAARADVAVAPLLLKTLLDAVPNGADIDVVSSEGCTPLGSAVRRYGGSFEQTMQRVALLLARGANPLAASTASGQTPLHDTAAGLNSRGKNLPLLLAMLDALPAGTNIDVVCGRATPLYNACCLRAQRELEDDHVMVVQALLSRGAQPLHGASKAHDSASEWTPLWAACMPGANPRIVQALVAALPVGASVDICNSHGETPLHSLVARICGAEPAGARSLAVVQVLLDAGADPCRLTRPPAEPPRGHMVTANPHRYLHLTSVALRRPGARSTAWVPPQRAPTTALSALHIAATHDVADRAPVLTTLADFVLAHAAGRGGSGVSGGAAQRAESRTASDDVLPDVQRCSRGCDIDVPDGAGWTPLMTAAQYLFRDPTAAGVKVLLAAGANPLARCTGPPFRSAVGVAAQFCGRGSGAAALCALLCALPAGAHVDECDDPRCPAPLAAACQTAATTGWRDPSAVVALLAVGADPTPFIVAPDAGGDVIDAYADIVARYREGRCLLGDTYVPAGLRPVERRSRGLAVMVWGLTTGRCFKLSMRRAERGGGGGTARHADADDNSVSASASDTPTSSVLSAANGPTRVLRSLPTAALCDVLAMAQPQWEADVASEDEAGEPTAPGSGLS